MHLQSIIIIATLASASAFAPTRARTCTTFASRSTSSLNIVVGDERTVSEKVADVFAKSPEVNAEFEEKLLVNFPGAIDNKELVTKVVNHLSGKGYSSENTLLATSFCCDELARQLEDDFNGVYGTNFNLGGLAGFPFAGETGFGAMSMHIPDDGYCFIVYAPHVGVTKEGTIGKVERAGIELVDKCCRSATLASDYVKLITDGELEVTMQIQKFIDFQQGAVQQLILPHANRLAAADDRMTELPYALHDSQEMLMNEIIRKGSSGLKQGLALLGGIQINTGPDTLDYFVPLRFDFINNEGEIVEDMLPSLVEK